MYLELFLILFSGISFLVYGINSFLSKQMVKEYERWGYKDYRYMIGFFQLMGGAGLLIGLFYEQLILITSLCLTIMMTYGVYVRFKIGDSIKMTIPALFYTIINALILYLDRANF
ncbi:MAG: hypothetical protein CMC81_04540 [Flavobacteriaceae bacterium]|nr:hypothetical protein [Flavobacteriaceae bacterium]|tara:strand:- start:1849 stop:2193 length:345 start_codon:yes stop_codon:yes gene_type:complete